MSILGSDTATNIIIFLALGVVIGTIVDWFLNTFKVPLPYTVVIFYVGAILGIAVDSTNLNISSYFDLSGVSSTIILYVFLPVLLFSETMTLNLHHLKQFFNQALLLAGPGAIIVCLLIAVCSKVILPYDWPWMYCFLFGAIFCATDPVSVVSTLKASKASTKLTMIIAGESLLNDGSAMILYLFFFNMINGVVYTPSLFISFCAEMLILSPLIGLVIGLLIVQIMRYLYQPLNDHLDLQILLTFLAAYLSYTVAAYFAQVSGVLSCCAAGLMIAFFAPIRILENEKYHAIWSNAEWSCNTLIFLLAGFIGGLNVTYEVTVINVCTLISMYLIITVIRGIMLFGLLPFTNMLGKTCSWYEMIFATHAGLRGALGIALALQVATSTATNHDDADNRIGAQIFFVTTGLASFTLLLNAPTASYVLLKLHLITDPKAAISAQLELMLIRIKLFMHKLLRKELIALKYELKNYNEEEVLASFSMLDTNILHTIASGAMQKSIQERSTKYPKEQEHIQNKHNQQSIQISSFSSERDSNGENETAEDDENEDGNGNGNGNGNSEVGRRDPSSSSDIFHTLRESLSQYHDHQTNITSLEQLDHDLIQFVRKTFLDIVKAYYYKAIQTGKIGNGSLSARLLLYSIEVAYDSLDVQLNDWDVIVHALLPNHYMIFGCKLIDRICESCFHLSPGLLAKHDAYYERLTTFTITTFIDAHEYAQSQMDYCLGVFLFDELDQAMEEGTGIKIGTGTGTLPKFHSFLKTKEEIQVTTECNIMLTRAKNVLTFLSARDLEIVYTHRAINFLLQKQTEIVNKIVDEGILSSENTQYFQEMLTKERKAFNTKRKEQVRGMLLTNVQNKLVQEESEMNGRPAMILGERESILLTCNNNGEGESEGNKGIIDMQTFPSSPNRKSNKKKSIFVAMNEDVQENSPASSSSSSYNPILLRRTGGAGPVSPASSSSHEN